MRTAVIGANGFIGSRLVESFHLGDGPAVVPVCRRPSHVALSTRFAVDVRIADALDEDALTAALEGCAAAVHAVRGAPADRKRLASVFCRAAARARIKRVVYLSSASVHGEDPDPGTHEKTRAAPASLDEEALLDVAAERQFFTEARRAGLIAYALRPRLVFGPRSKCFASIAEDLRAERAWLLQRGENVCNTVYVDNLVAAVRLCLRAKTGAGQPFIIGDAETITWREWYEAIARELDLSARRIRHVDVAPAGADPTLAVLQRSRAKLSFASAAKTLGYAPTVSLPEAIRRSCAWWRFAEGNFFAAA